MSRQQRGGTGEVARGAGYAALLGALLIGVAVIIGIVLLQIGDRNDNGPASATKPPPSSTTTTTTVTSKTTRTQPTTPATPAIKPGVLKVIVLNAGAKSGQASVMSNALKADGYTSMAVANDWTGHTQVGNSVYCRAGLGREGARLVALVGPAGGVPLHIPFPANFSPNGAGKDCVVVVGSKT